MSVASIKRAKNVLLSDPKLTKAVETGQTTVTEAARQIAQRAKPKKEKEVVRDMTGYAVPRPAMPFWERKGESHLNPRQ